MNNKWIVLAFALLFAVSCTSDNKPDKTEQSDKKASEVTQKAEYFLLNSPTNADIVTANTTVDFKINLLDSLQKIDSVHVFLDNNFIHSDSNTQFAVNINPKKVGNNSISIQCFFSGGLTQRKSIRLFVLSDIIPKNIAYDVINTYPHSTENFTQGLVYKNGVLYEGTGGLGKSVIYASKLETGKVLKSNYLPADKFGEGIAILNDKLVQLTYKGMEGYVYDIHSFKQIRQFQYAFNTEGWGLATDGKNFIMSNGTDKIYTLDSTYYAPTNEITVCDHMASIDSLNELEYIEGTLYSNIWMSNKIAQIDYKSGKVLGYLDLEPITPERYKNHHSDVLNGIAYRRDNNSLLITGKNWDTIYEIRLEEDKPAF